MSLPVGIQIHEVTLIALHELHVYATQAEAGQKYHSAATFHRHSCVCRPAAVKQHAALPWLEDNFGLPCCMLRIVDPFVGPETRATTAVVVWW